MARSRFPLLAVLALACDSGKGDVDEGQTDDTDETGEADPDGDGDGYVEPEDCHDEDPDVHPGAAEECDGLDNDCDGEIDEGVLVRSYMDADGDGYGDPAVFVDECTSNTAMVPNPDDCDDTSGDVHPGADELCNGIDDDCDGEIDEDDVLTWYADTDGDGYGDPGSSVEDCAEVPGHVLDATDCDDGAAGANPGAAEVCDGIDDDCDGEIDEDDAADASTWYADADGDGFGDPDASMVACSPPSGFVADLTDCDDTTSAANPDEVEVCDELDNDCDGAVDEGVTTTWYADTDGDGYGDAAVQVEACAKPSGYVADATDCDDGDAAAYPGAVETWYDGVDSDCAGDGDDDADGDGYDSEAHGGLDCDDADPSIHPGVDDDDCDGFDDDCDTAVDEDVYGDSSCPGLDCEDIADTALSTADGVYFVDPDGTGAYAVFCDMTHDGGGWTLVATSSDDGTTTWTWDDRALLGTDATTVGAPTAPERDFKSIAYNSLLFADLLFVHAPSGVWASYHAVGDGTSDAGSFVASIGDLACWMGGDGYAMSDGTLSATGNLCSTELFLNAYDHDGAASCSGDGDDTSGPSWSAANNTGCPFDDPSLASFGPSNETGQSALELDGRGFGGALGLNTGTSGAGENHLRMYVR